MLSENAHDLKEQLRRACAELSRRLRAGESCSAEELIDAFPSLGSDPGQVLELILAELSVRRELGQRPSPNEWYERFPQYRGQLRSWFEAQGKPSDSVPPDSVTVVQSPRSAEERPAPRPVAGRMVGRYEIQGELGRGGMGVVYKAWDVVLNRPVALKMIRGGAFAGVEEVQRFYREAQVAARLKHPNIVPIHDIDQHEGQDFFIMEFVGGGNLAGHRDRFRDDPRAATALVAKVARAVHFLHGKGVLHRDLKPGNILLDEQGEPRVTDFGLAKFAEGDLELTRTGQVVGTPAYLAPELVAPVPAPPTVQSDVWALGVILYELLTGQRPFQGQGFKTITARILQEAPPRPRSLKRDLDPGLEAVVLKCLEKDPGRRYPSAEALAEDLDRWLRGEAPRARPRGWLRRGWGGFRRRPRLAGLAALLLLAAAGLPLVLHFTDPDRPLKALQQRLARGEPATLIAASGTPGWYREVLDEGGVIQLHPRDQTFTLGSLNLCLLELLRDPQGPYRLTAWVRNNNSAGGGVGLFFGYRVFDTPQGKFHCFCTLDFDDLHFRDADPRRRKSSVRLDLHGYNKKAFIFMEPVQGMLFDPAAREPVSSPPWRKLVVEVREEKIRVAWEKEPFFFEISRSDLVNRFHEKARKLPPGGPSPRFSPRDGLGIFVRLGEASFREVTVEPLR